MITKKGARIGNFSFVIMLGGEVIGQERGVTLARSGALADHPGSAVGSSGQPPGPPCSIALGIRIPLLSRDLS